MAKMIIEKIKVIKRREFARPDLKERRGNFAKWIGLTIKNPRAATNISAVLGSPKSPCI